MQLEVIGPAVCIDDKVGDEIRTGGLHQDVDTFGWPGAALGVADDPPHGISGSDRP